MSDKYTYDPVYKRRALEPDKIILIKRVLRLHDGQTNKTNALGSSCKIVESLKLGNYIETAAALVGINKTSIYEWLKRGARELERVENNPNARIRREEQPFVDAFFQRHKKITGGSGATRPISYSQSQPKRSESIGLAIERKYPHRWGGKTEWILKPK